MFVTNIKNLLFSFCFEDEQTRTLLIDGKWGCGKTYNVKKFLKNNPKQNVIYVSLFGTDNKEDVLSILSEYLDSSYVINVGGKKTLRSVIEEKPYCGYLIVFDDFERRKKLELSNICGIVDALRSLGFKVVCVSNLENLLEKKEFYQLAEKTFDTIVTVEADSNSFRDVSGIDTAINESILNAIQGNWRIVKRAKSIYESIIKFAKEKRGIENFFEKSGMDDSTLFVCVILALKCFFSNNNKTPTFKKEYDLSKYTYERHKEIFGENVANEFYDLFYVQKENSSYKQIVESVLQSLIKSDYDYFINQMIPSVNEGVLSEKPLLQKNIFLLDDKGRKEYKREFFDNLDFLDFSKDIDQKILFSVIMNYIGELNNNQERNIVKRLASTIHTNDHEDFLDSLRLVQDKNTPEFDAFYKKVLDAFSTEKKTEITSFIDNSLSSKDYGELNRFLFENRATTEMKKEEILNSLKNRYFCLPDLAKEVEPLSWTFCHEVAKYVAGTSFQKDFVNVLKEQCKKSKSTSLRRKCNALVKYNFNENIDFFNVLVSKK